MSYDIGINFRATSGFVTDPANTTYSLGEAYPTTRSMATSGLSVTFGFATTDIVPYMRDRDTGVDPRLTGLAQVNALMIDDQLFRIDLPASGTWQVNLAAGENNYPQSASWQVLDSNGSTVLASQTSTAVSAANWRDASQVNRTSAADWVSNNAPINVTFSGTTAYLKLVSVTPASVMSHFRLYQASSGATVSTITGTTVTEAGNGVFTVTMSGTGGGTFAYSWSGTATAGVDYTSTLTNGMFTTTGGSGSVTVSGSNITVPSTVTAFTVTVSTAGDTIDEANETYTLTIGGTAGTGTINDDDAAPVITVGDAPSVTAGSPAIFTITLDRAKSTSITVDAACVDGTLVGGVGYTSNLASATISNGVTFGAGALTIPAGVTSFTVSIPTAA